MTDIPDEVVEVDQRAQATADDDFVRQLEKAGVKLKRGGSLKVVPATTEVEER